MKTGRPTILMTAVLLLGPGAAMALAQDQAATKPPVVSHELDGRDQCSMCHMSGMEGIPQAPASHEGRDNSTCLWCHAADAAIQTAEAMAIAHELEGRDQCGMCHTSGMEGVPQAPADHEGRPNDSCTLCHQPSS